MKKPLFLFLTCVAALPVRAQDTATTAAAPATAKPHVVIETVGPQGWRARLGPTNVGSMLASEKGRKMWEPTVLPQLQMLREAIGEGSAALEQRLMTYQGRIRAAAWFDEVDDRTGNAACVALEADGRTDLDALCAELVRLQTLQFGEPARKMTVGADDYEVMEQHGRLMSKLAMRGKTIVLALGDETGLPLALAHANTLVAAATGKPPLPTQPALSIEIDTATLLELGMRRDAERQWSKALGLFSLGSTTLTVSGAGPSVAIEVAQRFTDDERGIFAALFPAAKSTPKALVPVPAATTSWGRWRFDALAMFNTIVQAAISSGEMTEEELRQEMRTDMGIELDKDLLAHMTDELQWFGVGSPASDGEAESWCVAVGVKDGAAFLKGLTTALEQAGPFVMASEGSDIEGTKVHHYSVFGSDFALATAEGRAVLCFGRDIEATLTSALQALRAGTKEGAGDAKAASETAGFEDLQNYLPAGCTLMTRGGVSGVLALPELLVMGYSGGFMDPTEPMMDPDESAELLRAHHLDFARAAAGYADRVARLRIFW